MLVFSICAFSFVRYLDSLQNSNIRRLHLEPVTSSIEELKDVKSMELGCSSLETLPDRDVLLGRLRDLRCKNIRSLDLSETGIEKLPPWLGCFTNLKHLKLRNIAQNDVLLSGLSHLTSLEVLDLFGSNFGSLPSCISSFSRLNRLNVSGCKQLHTIPLLSSSVLRVLNFSNCTNLRALPDFSNLQCLSGLLLGGCNSLECIPGFQTIAENIEYLELPGPSGGIQCSNLSNDFKSKLFMVHVRFNCRKKCSSLKLILEGMISSPVDMVVVIEDDHVLFETRLAEDDFDKDDEGSKIFSFEGRDDEEILEYIKKESGTILV
ncbi:putative disease resistance protein [Nymphaea thermarum]|nr:putative disease resistance protein [Nymphaea thermarum]